MKSEIKRRNFLKTTSAMSIGMALSPGFVYEQSLSNTRKEVSILKASLLNRMDGKMARLTMPI